MAHGPHARAAAAARRREGGGAGGEASGPGTCWVPAAGCGASPGAGGNPRPLHARGGAGSAPPRPAGRGTSAPPAESGLRGRAPGGGGSAGPHPPAPTPHPPPWGGGPAGSRAPRTRSSLRCKFRRDKLLISSLEEKAVFFLFFFSLSVFISAWPPATPRAASPPGGFSSSFQYPKENANRHAAAFLKS